MSAVHKLITDHLDIWTAADAEKKSGRGRTSGNANSVYGIKKLRELILELAVRGKLVPQDPNDEPVSELLKKIIDERQSKGLPTKDLGDRLITPDSHFPIEWRQVKLGAIALIERGGSPRPIQDYITNDPDGLNWIKIGDTEQGGKYIRATSEKIRREGLTNTRMVYPGDFLLTNSMSFGRPYISQIEGCIHDGWLRISPPTMLDKDYLYNLLSSPLIVEQFRKAAAGAVELNLNADKVREVKVPIPPLEEQHRIVAKVDELMALCDQLEAQHNNAADAHEQLVSHLLSTLTQSQDAADFNANWQRIATHFDTLFTTESSIDALKQTLLQLAVMGKLVPQDPNDEPASELLKRIQDEKAKLVAEGKIKKDKPLAAITDDEKLFRLPNGWIFSRLNDVFDVRDGTHDSPKFLDAGYPFITSKNLYTGKLDFSDVKYVSEEDHRKFSIRSNVQRGDILFAMIGSIGNPAIVETDIEFSIKNVALIKPYQHKLNNAHYLLLNLKASTEKMKSEAGGGVQSFISLGNLRKHPIAIPPLAEQHRIVAKVDELLILCDQLKFRIVNTRRAQQKIADVLIEHTLEG